MFDADEEKCLFEYLTTCSKLNYGLTLQDARSLASDLANANGTKMPDNWQPAKKAGIDWMKAFMKRHPLSLRKPEGCSLARNAAFNKENVALFYDNLKGIYEKYPIFKDGTRVYNLDETG